MPRSHPPYPPVCRAEAVRLARSGERTPERLSHDQACSAQAARADGLTTAELEEPGRLRREVRMLRLEREILRKRVVGGPSPIFGHLAGTVLAAAIVMRLLTAGLSVLFGTVYAGPRFFG